MPTLDVVIPEEIGEANECVIVTWLKREGDAIRQDDTLFVIQAEKASYDVAAPASGRLVAILAGQGDVVERGQVVARMEVVSEAEAQPPAPAAAPATETPPSAPATAVRASPIARRLAREHDVDLAQVAGSGREGRITEKDVLAFVAARPAAEAAPSPGPSRAAPASPVAKRIAREHNIDLAQISGSGRDGRITEKDVLTFIEARVTSEPAPGEPQPDEAAERPVEATVPLAGMRGAIARRMHESLHAMAQLTLLSEADVTELVAHYESLKAESAITYTDLIVKACALALGRHPQLNATLEEDRIRLLPQINIGVAVALEDGLVVPVITDADRRSLATLAEARRRLVERARGGQLTPDEMSGGTFTVTNLGPYEIDGFTPIVNPPEAAILGVGRIVEKVVVHQGKIAQRAMMTLSLTFDHRLVDGAPAAAFLQSIKQLLESPSMLR